MPYHLTQLCLLDLLSNVFQRISYCIPPGVAAHFIRHAKNDWESIEAIYCGTYALILYIIIWTLDHTIGARAYLILVVPLTSLHFATLVALVMRPIPRRTRKLNCTNDEEADALLIDERWESRLLWVLCSLFFDICLYQAPSIGCNQVIQC